MTRGGHKDENDDVERKCIVTGEVQPKAGLIRFVIGPDNQVVPDILGKLPGRGIYVTADCAILEQARKGQFSRSAKQAVTVPDGLLDEVERQYPQRATALVGFPAQTTHRNTAIEICPPSKQEKLVVIIHPKVL